MSGGRFPIGGSVGGSLGLDSPSQDLNRYSGRRLSIDDGESEFRLPRLGIDKLNPPGAADPFLSDEPYESPYGRSDLRSHRPGFRDSLAGSLALGGYSDLSNPSSASPYSTDQYYGTSPDSPGGLSSPMGPPRDSYIDGVRPRTPSNSSAGEFGRRSSLSSASPASAYSSNRTTPSSEYKPKKRVHFDEVPVSPRERSSSSSVLGRTFQQPQAGDLFSPSFPSTGFDGTGRPPSQNPFGPFSIRPEPIRPNGLSVNSEYSRSHSRSYDNSKPGSFSWTSEERNLRPGAPGGRPSWQVTRSSSDDYARSGPTTPLPSVSGRRGMSPTSVAHLPRDLFDEDDSRQYNPYY